MHVRGQTHKLMLGVDLVGFPRKNRLYDSLVVVVCMKAEWVSGLLFSIRVGTLGRCGRKLLISGLLFPRNVIVICYLLKLPEN